MLFSIYKWYIGIIYTNYYIEYSKFLARPETSCLWQDFLDLRIVKYMDHEI